MKASNEEMMSMNEELQSVNEELETSKEELQSTNEELITVNNQLNQKLVELNAVNNDISNLLDSTDIPTVFLTTELRIRRFTPSAIKLFHLLATDLGRPIADLTRTFASDQLLDDCRAMLETRRPIEREVRAENDQYLPAARSALLDRRAARRRSGDHFHRSHRAQTGRRLGQRGALVCREHRGHRARAPGGSGRLPARTIGQSVVFQGVPAQPRRCRQPAAFLAASTALGYSRASARARRRCWFETPRSSTSSWSCRSARRVTESCS